MNSGPSKYALDYDCSSFELKFKTRNDPSSVNYMRGDLRAIRNCIAGSQRLSHMRKLAVEKQTIRNGGMGARECFRLSQGKVRRGGCHPVVPITIQAARRN